MVLHHRNIFIQDFGKTIIIDLSYPNKKLNVATVIVDPRSASVTTHGTEPHNSILR